MKSFYVLGAILSMGLCSVSAFSQNAKDAEIGQKLGDKAQEVRKQITNMRAPAEPFKMIGNLYFVGIQNGDAYLLTSTQGHILFGAGFAESGELIEKNIESLGFKLTDVKAIVINHGHLDQTGGALYLKQKSGAKLMAAFGEIPYIENGGRLPVQQPNPAPAAPGAAPQAVPPAAPPAAPAAPLAPQYPPVKVDRALNDGDVIKVGSSTVTTYLFPGHSAASASFVFNVSDGRHNYKAIQFCCWEYPEDLSRGIYINEATVRRNFETLHKIGPVDIYLELGRYAWGGVVNQPDQLSFAERIDNVRKNPMLFVNRDTFREMTAAREVEFDRKLANLKKTNPVYAQ